MHQPSGSVKDSTKNTNALANGSAQPSYRSLASALIRRIWMSSLRRANTAWSAIRRSKLLFAADLASALVALVVAFILRYGMYALADRPDLVTALLVAAPPYLAICAITFPLAGLYSRNWRYGSVSDIISLMRAVAITSVLLVCVLFFATRLADIPRTAVLIDAILLTAFLGASRLTFRFDELVSTGRDFSMRRHDEARHVPILLVGGGDAADLYLRALSRDRERTHHPVGILDIDSSHKGRSLRGVPFLGALEDYEDVFAELKLAGHMPRHVVFTMSPAALEKTVTDRFLRACEERGIATSRISQLTDLKNAVDENRFELRSIELTDLLERPQAQLDRDAIQRLIAGRRVLVTGAGGSIGSELTLQIAACGPSELVVIDNTEFNLYSIDMELSERFPEVPRVAHLCNVTRSKRVDDIFAVHRPEIVFHAAALKHVPMVELNPCEGALTNVIGSMNIANATRKYGALAMVQISTDKVVNPTSVMGATKRLAELYCQAQDLAGFAEHRGPRFMTVRFGNVLGSSGSLIPLFKKQLSRGGPLTVTDAEMTRFFMTIREAVELTLQASAYGLEGEIGQGEIFVLDMGEPIRIIDIARRMIRLAGFTPDKDVEIKIIGLRPGEKLYEELFDSAEDRVPSPVPGVLGAVPSALPLALLEDRFAMLQQHAEMGEEDQVLAIMSELIPGYRKEVRKVRPMGPAITLAANDSSRPEDGKDASVASAKRS